MSQTQITSDNFEENFEIIKATLEESKFIAIDVEFSALNPLKTPSLFDDASERYEKLRRNVQKIAPLQIGITAFSFDRDKDSFLGTSYNFYVVPACFGTIDKAFYFQASTLRFLHFHDFDFEKFGRLSIPYMNRVQEKALREILKNEDELNSTVRFNTRDIYDEYDQQLNSWYSSNDTEELMLPQLYEKIKGNHEILYYVHKNCRTKFKNVYTYVKDKAFVLKKVSEDEYKKLEKSENLEEHLISELLGFTKIFRLLVSLRKPIVGHNLFQDLLLMIENFESPLPPSYKSFKYQIHELFPLIFDTKTISYETRHLVPEEKRWIDKGLESIFDYFKHGFGRHLAPNSPAIEINCDEAYGKCHEAGWDSFCTGYIFIRMAYLNIYEKYPKSKKFVCSELIGGLMDYKNRVNIIRGFLSSIRLDGEDPQSTRPPYLVIESIKKQPIDVHKVSSVLSPFGFVEIKKLPYQSKMALIAVDNFGSSKRILKNFQCNKDYQIKQYSVLKHSPMIRLLGGLTVSGFMLLVLTYSLIKK